MISEDEERDLNIHIDLVYIKIILSLGVIWYYINIWREP